MILQSVATLFGANNPPVTTTSKPSKPGHGMASKLFIFDTSNENLNSEELASTEKPKVYVEPRESLNERQERIRLEKFGPENPEALDFDGSGVRARGGIWEENEK